MKIDGRARHRSARTPGRLARFAGMPALEALEPRLALSAAPLPTLSALESPNDTVVRIETNYGDIDIELFNSAAPITVSNFLNYVNSGRFGDSFFHRSSLDPNPFVLQGGGFTYSDTAGLVPIATDAPIIREATGRSNLAQTVSMARTSDLNSGTSQFFINYVDNTFLDPTSAADGYAVFGKVIQGWNVVQTIEALQSLDLTSSPAFAGDFASNFGEVPLGASYNANVGVRQADLVNLISAEVIKPASVNGFYTQKVVYPEGFRSATSVETLDLVNPNGFSGSYQVTVHYETGLRDTVVSTGTLAADSKLTITLSDFAQPGLNNVRLGVPYSVEVTSAFPEAFAGSVQPVAASMNRFDFGADTGEAFLNPSAVTASGALQSWDLPRIERNSLSEEFIVYQNLSDTAATVTTVFHTAGGDFIAVRSLDPYRRGGLEVFSLGLPEGVLWAHVSSDQDIVVAVSDWDLPSSSGGQSVPTPAFGVLGVPGGGSTAGGYAGAEIQEGFTSNVSVVNSGASAAAVTLKFWATSGFTSTKLLAVAAGGSASLDLDPADIGIAAGEVFTVTYTSDNPVEAQYTSFTRQPGANMDGVASTFSNALPPVAYFADGQLDPSLSGGQQTETISIFSPFASSLAYTFTFTVRYYFSDGTTIDGAAGTLSANGRLDIVSGDITAVRTKAASNPAFHDYAIGVIGLATNNSTMAATAIAPLAVLTRWDTVTGEAVSSGPMFSGVGIAFGDMIFA